MMGGKVPVYFPVVAFGSWLHTRLFPFEGLGDWLHVYATERLTHALQPRS